MKKYLLIVLLASFGLVRAQATKTEATAIQWMSFEEAVKKSETEKEKKKIFIDVYTDWCGWCKVMDKNTFVDPQIVKLINEKFYAVKFDAETKDSVLFKDKYFQFKPEYKSNELAALLMNGKMSYPTSVYLDGESNLIGPVPGYLTAEQFLPVLKYFAEDFYKTTSWEDYMNSQIK